MFILKGSIQICEPKTLEPFCIMPCNSYLGDFEILKGKHTLFVIKALVEDSYYVNTDYDAEKSYAFMHKSTSSIIKTDDGGIFN